MVSFEAEGHKALKKLNTLTVTTHPLQAPSIQLISWGTYGKIQ